MMNFERLGASERSSEKTGEVGKQSTRGLGSEKNTITKFLSGLF
jgi:hypothetical protein